MSQHSHKFKNSTFLEFKKGALIFFLSGECALFLQVQKTSDWKIVCVWDSW